MVAQNRRPVLSFTFVGALGLALLGAGSALAHGGVDWQAMLEACQRAMAAMSLPLSPEQLQAMRSMVAGCAGMGMGR